MQESKLAVRQTSNVRYGYNGKRPMYGMDAWLHTRGSRTCPGTEVPRFNSMSPGMACMGAREAHHAMI